VFLRRNVRGRKLQGRNVMALYAVNQLRYCNYRYISEISLNPILEIKNICGNVVQEEIKIVQIHFITVQRAKRAQYCALLKI
jgi:hypothetical protein